jgi:hypothetical protein
MHQNKESSDQTAHEAAELLRADAPMLVPDGMADAIIDAVGKARNRDEARIALRLALDPLFQRVRSIAASVVSQGDGPE